MNRLRRKIAVIFSMALVISTVEIPAREGLASESEWSRDFTIFRDGDSIGSHSIRIARTGERIRVRLDTEIEVSIAFITVYRRTESQQEVWENGTLESFQSRVDDDGQVFVVDARRTPDGLSVMGDDQSYIAPENSYPATYWSSAFLNSGNLIDLKRGNLQQFDIAERKTISSENGDGEYVLLAGEKKREFWFDGEGYLIETQFVARDGSKIAYRVTP